MRIDKEGFVQRVRDVYGERVELLSEYQGTAKRLTICYHCEKHGDTVKEYVRAKTVFYKDISMCNECAKEKRTISAHTKLCSKSDLINRLIDYCNSHDGYVVEKEWLTAKHIYHFKCNNPEHPIFTSSADSMITKKTWCLYCCGRKGNFQKKYESVINNNNGTMLSEYVNAVTKINVRCNIDNYEWEILPQNLLKGRWCPICSMNFNERVMWDWFQNHNIHVVPQYEFENLIGQDGVKLKFDFGITINDKFVLIEIDDCEHYDNHSSTKRIAARQRDEVKNEYCKSNNIELVRIKVPYRGKANRPTYEDYYNYLDDIMKEVV